MFTLLMGVQGIAPYFLRFPATLHKIRCRKCRKISLTVKIGRVKSILTGVYKFLSVLSSSIGTQEGIKVQYAQNVGKSTRGRLCSFEVPKCKYLYICSVKQYDICKVRYTLGTRWRSWLRHCAASREVAGSVPDRIIFLWLNSFWPQYGPWFDSASNGNVY
jgi:hypothetical protein